MTQLRTMKKHSICASFTLGNKALGTIQQLSLSLETRGVNNRQSAEIIQFPPHLIQTASRPGARQDR